MAAHHDSRSSEQGSTRRTFLKSFPKTLVVEDNPNDAFSLQCALKEANIEASVHFVSDEQEAIEYLRGKELFEYVASPSLPGLLLVALELPQGEGLGLLQWLKQRPHLRPARVVVFSSASKPGEEQQALALGADYYLTKPVAPADFCTALSHLQRLLLDGPKRPGAKAESDHPKPARAAA